jgi:hypothetical protein
MTAKVTLIGQPQSLCMEKDGVVTFCIVTGPASNTAPKGLPLFKATTYVVQCTQRQLNRGRASDRDKSELVIEGYQEPRIGEDGKPYIAVVALSVASKQAQAERKLEQLREEVAKAEDAYNAACDHYGDESPQARAASEAFEKMKAGLVKFMAGHPESK